MGAEGRVERSHTDIFSGVLGALSHLEKILFLMPPYSPPGALQAAGLSSRERRWQEPPLCAKTVTSNCRSQAACLSQIELSGLEGNSEELKGPGPGALDGKTFYHSLKQSAEGCQCPSQAW